MDDGSFNPSNNPVFGNIDYGLMEQLLDEGCWIQTADGSNLLQSGISTSRGLSFPGYPMIPGLDPSLSGLTSEKWVPNKEQQAAVDSERQENRQAITSSATATATIATAAAAAAARRSLSWESNELNKMLWIPPPRLNNSGASSSVKDRLMQAIYHLTELNKNRDVLIQIWVPIKKGLQSFLTTVEQPYFIPPTNKRLHSYRDVSERYEFLADEDTKQAFGLPGRVFLGKAPEWTPDVQFFKQDEYPRITFARQYDVRGSIALPVFEKGSAHSLGVVEIIMTTDRFDYRPEVENVCKALETVHLRSSEIRDNLQEQAGKGTYEAVQPEILTVVRTVCDTFDLPLAQTWAPCSQQGKGGCWHSDNNALCLSIIDSACYVRDQRVLDFHRACSDHHLLRSQGGIVGKAFETNQPCYAIDVTEFSKVEYPLSHHAKKSGLRGAIAIRLRGSGIYHGHNDYVIELYLPSTIQETGLAFHTRIWQSVSLVIQQHCRYLHFITDKDFEEKRTFPGKSITDNIEATKETSWFSQLMEPQRKGKEVVSLEFGDKEPSSKGFKVMNWSDSSEPSLQLGQAFSDGENINQDSASKEGISGSSSGGQFPLSSRKAGERRRTKTQKTISLDILKQHFAGSLKDAARSIGVCPTTLKRICRQHGIARWPSRKIKKVDHSLRKLQLVIDSVQGAEGSIQLSSFYTKFPELNSPTIEPKPNNQVSSSINLNNQPKQQNSTAPEGTVFPSGAATTTSSNSSSQTSTSSYCFSSEAKISSPVSGAVVGSGTSKDPLTADDPSGSLQRTRSEAELLHVHSKKDESNQTVLERSQSNKTLAEHPSFEPLPPLPIIKSWPLREAGVFKAKATFGDEKVRFTVLPSMGFLELQKAIIKRFNFEDFSKMGIKYLDDDKEWVLLTCDADLEECIDIHKSIRSHTIKLCVSPLSSLAGSFGSSGLS